MTRKERWAMYAQGAMLAVGIMVLGWLCAAMQRREYSAVKTEIQCSEFANSTH